MGDVGADRPQRCDLPHRGDIAGRGGAGDPDRLGRGAGNHLALLPGDGGMGAAGDARHQPFPARRLGAPDRQHGLSVGVRRRHRGRAGARALSRVLSAVRHRRVAGVRGLQSQFRPAAGRRIRGDLRHPRGLSPAATLRTGLGVHVPLRGAGAGLLGDRRLGWAAVSVHRQPGQRRRRLHGAHGRAGGRRAAIPPDAAQGRAAVSVHRHRRRSHADRGGMTARGPGGGFALAFRRGFWLK